MTHELILPEAMQASLRSQLLDDPRLERLAVVFAGRRRADRSWRFLGRDVWVAGPADYRIQEAFHLEMEPTFWARAAKRARVSGESIVVVHSHPHDPDPPDFSPSDDWGEGQLMPKLRARAEVPHATVVISPGGMRARLHDGRTQPLRVRAPWQMGEATPGADSRYERQVLALGPLGHARLRSLSVAVVGLGGTGSHVAQQLLHLGVGRLLAVDPDHVEESNLSRLVGGNRRDAKRVASKTDLVVRQARGLGGPTKVTAMRASVVDDAVARKVAAVDVVFGCTDTQRSRLVLNSIAHQHYVPVIDLGVELRATGGVGGRVTVLGPGEGCLWCLGILAETRVRAEQLGPEERRAQYGAGYVPDVDVPEPAVVSINGVVASLAVTEFLDRVTGFRGVGDPPGMLLYRLLDGTVRRASVQGRSCPACAGVTRGAGELAALPTARGACA